MVITVNLWSGKSGEIKKFLECYYGREVEMDEDVGRWIYVYRKPIDAVDIISAVMDNDDRFKIGLFIQINDGDIHPITYENHNDVIKGMFQLFYEENLEISC